MAVKKEKKPKISKEEGFYRWEDDILVLSILGKPSSKRDAIGKPKGNQLKISVTATPEAEKPQTTWSNFWPKNLG